MPAPRRRRSSDPDHVEAAPQQKRDRRPWPYSVGSRGVNRVRVYSRDDSGVCQVEWWDDRGRQQRSLRTVLGEAVTDRTLARDIAEAMSVAQAEKRNRAAAALVFGNAGRSLEHLLKRLHEHRKASWSKKYAADQERYRLFWLDFLGKDVPLVRIHRLPLRAMLDEHGGKQKKPWSERTKQAYLRYLVDAFIFGRDTLKIIDTRYDLAGIELPTPNKKGPAYSTEEVQRLLPALWKRDPRAWLVMEAYYQAGRRKNATRLLELTDLRFATLQLEDGPVRAAVLTYRAPSDKTRTESEAVLVGAETLKRLHWLIDQPAVRSSGYLLPAGELSSPKAKKPIREETLNRLLHDAEADAEIKHVKGRAYHGGKRNFGRMTAKDRGIASAQSNTTAKTLDRYDPHDDLITKAELALKLVRRRG